MSTALGRAAESAAAAYLRKAGYKILSQNWRTRWCEIDIVAQKAGIIYFVEAKFRAGQAQGSGLDYITPRKLQQMHVAAEFWQAGHNTNADYRLAAIELTGDPPRVTAWLNDIE